MPVMDRVRRSSKAKGEERPERSAKQAGEQEGEQTSQVGNQAMLRMGALRRRAAKPPAQDAETPDEKANEVVGRFESDPMDQSGRTRADVGAMPPSERGEVLDRVRDKVTDTGFDRIGHILGEPGPRTPDAPPEEVHGGAEQPEEIAAPGEAPEQAPPGEAEAKPPEEKAKDRKPGKKAQENKPTKGKPAEENKSAAPVKDAEEAAADQAEQSGRERAEGEAEAKKAAKDTGAAGEKKPAAEAPAVPQANAALSDLPADAKESTQPAAAPGAPARQAAAQSGPAVVVAGGGGGGGGMDSGGGGGGEAAIDEAAGPESPEGAAAEEAAQDKMAASEEDAPPEEEKEPEPEKSPAEEESRDDGKKTKPSAEDEEAIRRAEQERQEQVRSPEGPAATQGAEEEQEPAPANADVRSADTGAGLASLAEPVGGGGEPSGGGGGGGAISDQPEAEPPKVEAMPPVAAMASVGALKVGQISKSISGIGSSVSEKMSGQRADLAANAPSMERPSGAPQTREARIDFGDGTGADSKGKVEETPDGEAVPVEEPGTLPDPGPAPTDALAAPPIAGGGEGGTLTEADAQNMSAAVDEVPTTDPALEQNAGAPPTVELAGDADPQQALDQRTALDQSIVDGQTQGAQDAAQPMGENEIYPVVPQETLTAQIPQGGGASATAAPTVDDETTAVVAEEKAGDDVRASATTASADMQAGEEEQATQAEEAKADNATKVEALKDENATQQAAKRSAAAGNVTELRGKWTQGQQQAVDTAHTNADGAQASMSTEVEAQRTSGNENAAKEIEKGNDQAAQLKDQAEGDARREKAKAEEESSGVLGWLASKAKAFFDGLKRAVHAVFDLARKALKGLIDGIKKLAAAAIDLARKAIVGAIRLAGKALIAIGDVALAAFPELRDKFRGYIEKKVQAAEDAVNRLADQLKAGINKLLDLLGSALDGLLNLLEKAYMAAIDIVAGAIQTAIKVAQAAIALLGLLAAIIRDVAAGPGQWISNLGAAIIDGIKNHLWKAFKAAVKNWFMSKLEEVLGIGMTIFKVLTQGGIAISEVATMAFEGLKSAIPPALIGVLVEKLVAMIVPAAGAVMAIIEGLQAAWGAVSRILQAIDKFVSFLKAVKGGGAGPKFADALAGAAIVVIDFVANWLIKKIRGPASKVGGKIKAIAKKILEKLKAAAKKVWAKVKKVFRKVVSKVKAAYRKVKEKLFGKKGKKGKAKQKDNEKKKKDKDKKVQEAVAKTQAAIDSMLAKGTRPLIMRARLAILKLQYGWQQLSLKRAGSGFEIAGSINPTIQISPNIVFDEVNATPFSIKEKEVAVVPSMDRPPSARDNLPVHGASSSKYESQVVGRGVAPAGQAGPLITPITGAGPVTNLSKGAAGAVDPGNKRLNPANSPDAILFLGQRQVSDNDVYRRRPDTLVQQNVGGTLLNSISIEATLDAQLKQGHKQTQMAETILAAQSVLGRFPNVAKPLQLFYIIVAPVPVPSDVRAKIISDLQSISKSVTATVNVKWVVVPIA